MGGVPDLALRTVEGVVAGTLAGAAVPHLRGGTGLPHIRAVAVALAFLLGEAAKVGVEEKRCHRR